MPFDFLKPKPKQTVSRYPTDFLLGDLLVKAGLISQQQLEEAVKMAGSKNVHVGQMLVNFRYISPRDLQAAVDAQSMLRDRTIDQNLAVGCLKIACKTGMTFAEVVRDRNAGSGDGLSNKLGELLLESGLVSKENLTKSMGRSQATGLPLGQILVLNGSLHKALLTMALEIQVRIRDGMMTREEGIEALSAAGGTEGGEASADIEETVRMTVLPPRKKGVRIGELLVMAKLINEADVMNALELGLVNSQQIGQVLIQQGYVTEEMLDAALELQRRIDADKLAPQDAAEALVQMKTTGRAPEAVLESIDAQVAEAESKQLVGFDKMLMLARIVSQDDIDNALERSAKNSQLLAKILHMTGYIDEMTMQAVLQCYTMMSNGFLTQDDAIVTLDYCLNREEKISFAEGLAHIGWNATMPMQVQGATSVDISQVKLGLFGAKGELPSFETLGGLGAGFGLSVDQKITSDNISPLAEPAAEGPGLSSLLDEMLDEEVPSQEIVEEAGGAEVDEEPSLIDALLGEDDSVFENAVAHANDESTAGGEPGMLGSLLDDISEEMELKELLSKNLPTEEELEPREFDELALNNEDEEKLQRRSELDEAARESNGGFDSISAEDVDASTQSYDNLPAFFKVLVDQEQKAIANSEQIAPDTEEVMNALDSILSGGEMKSAEAPSPVAEESGTNENRVVPLSELRGLFSSDKGTNGGGKVTPEPTDSTINLLNRLLPPDEQDVVNKTAAAEEAETAKNKAEDEAAEALQKAEQEAETARKSEEEAEAARAAEAEAAKLAAEEEDAARKAEEDAETARQVEAEAARKAQEEADAARKAEEDAAAARKAEEEAEAARKEEAAEATRKAEEEAEAARKLEAESAKKAAEEAEAARKAEAEAEIARKAAEESKAAEEAKTAAEAEARRKAEEEAEAARKSAEEAAAAEKAAEEARKASEEAEAARKAAEEEAARKAAEEAIRIAAEEDAARKAAEDEAARKAAEEEARIAVEAEAARAAAEAEAEIARKAAEAEAARVAEEEKARIAAEEEARKVAEEEARKAAEEEARKAAEEAARKTAEEEAAKAAAEAEAAKKAQPSIRDMKKFDTRAIMDDFDDNSLFGNDMLTVVHDDDYALGGGLSQPEAEVVKPAAEVVKPAAAASNEPLSLGSPDSILSDKSADSLPEVSAAKDESTDSYSSVLQGIIGAEAKEIGEIDDLFNADTEKKAAEALHVVEAEKPKLVSAQELLSQLEETIQSAPEQKPAEDALKPRSEAESIALKLISELADSVSSDEATSEIVAEAAQINDATLPAEAITKSQDPVASAAEAMVAKIEDAVSKSNADDAAALMASLSEEGDHEDVDSLFARPKPALTSAEMEPAAPAVIPAPTVTPAPTQAPAPVAASVPAEVVRPAQELVIPPLQQVTPAAQIDEAPKTVIEAPVAESIVAHEHAVSKVAEPVSAQVSAPAVAAKVAAPVAVPAGVGGSVGSSSSLPTVPSNGSSSVGSGSGTGIPALATGSGTNIQPVAAQAAPVQPAPAAPPAAAPQQAALAQAAAQAPAQQQAPAASSFWADALSQANVPEGAPAQGKQEPNPAVLQSVIIAQLEKQVEQAEGASAPTDKSGGAKNDLKNALSESLSRLAESYYEQGDYTQAQGLYERILLLKQNQLGSKHEALGADLTNLAGVLCVQGKFAEAEPYVKRIATIIEATQPLDSLRLAGCLNTLASVLFQQGKFAECEPLLERSLKLREEKHGAEHPEIADTLRDYAKLLRKLGRNADAELMYARAKAILAKKPKAAPAP